MWHRPGRSLEHQCSLIHHCCGFDTEQNSNHSYALEVHKLRTALLTGGAGEEDGMFFSGPHQQTRADKHLPFSQLLLVGAILLKEAASDLWRQH